MLTNSPMGVLPDLACPSVFPVPIRAYLPSLPAQHQTVSRYLGNIPPSSPKNAAIYLTEVDATQPPNLSGGGDCVANHPPDRESPFGRLKNVQIRALW